jgi:hypothetical protein
VRLQGGSEFTMKPREDGRDWRVPELWSWVLGKTVLPKRRERTGTNRLTPIILTTQEGEIRRIAVQSQLRQIVHKTLSKKYPTQNRAGRVAQLVQHWPSKHEALSSNTPPSNK